jgi:hypothetical protein
LHLQILNGEPKVAELEDGGKDGSPLAPTPSTIAIVAAIPSPWVTAAVCPGVRSIPRPSPRPPLGHGSKPVLFYVTASPMPSLVVGSTAPDHRCRLFLPRRGLVGHTNAVLPQAHRLPLLAVPTSIAVGSGPSTTGSGRCVLPRCG